MKIKCERDEEQLQVQLIDPFQLIEVGKDEVPNAIANAVNSSLDEILDMWEHLRL